MSVLAVDEDAYNAVAALPEEELLRIYWPAISELMGDATLAGERPQEAIVRFYEEVFKPKVALLARRNRESAQRVWKGITENALDLSLVSVGLVVSCLIDMQDYPEKPQQKVLAGFALLIIKVALKGPKENGDNP